jgi:Flp pilus assembly protein TadD
VTSRDDRFAVTPPSTGSFVEHAGRAITRYESGRIAEAAVDLDRAVALAPEMPELYQNRAVALRDLGRLDEAARDLRMYVELRPNADDRPEVEATLLELRALEAA